MRDFLRKVERRSKEYLRLQRYHYNNTQRAKEILRWIEEEKGKIEPALIRAADEYAADVLGWRGYAPWLHIYSAANGEFREGWLPENYYTRVVAPRLKGHYGWISRLKTFAGKLFQDGADMPHFFPDAGYYMNGLFLTDAYEILDPASVKTHLYRDCEKLVYKLDDSGQGKAIYFLDKHSFDPAKICALGNGVFQRWIEQHPQLEELSPTAVATLRVTTVVDNENQVSVRSAYIRLGHRGATHVGSGNSVRMAVDLNSGKIGEFGLSHRWHWISHHPDTEVRFGDFHVPAFHDCLATATGLHQKVPFVRCVGWDMAVDRQGRVNVMEWNGLYNGITVSETLHGPCFTGLGWENLWKDGKTPHTAMV